MIKSDRLEKKCYEMNGFQPHWGDYVKRFKSHPEFNPDRAFKIEKYIGLFGEIHTDFMLERFAASDQGFELDPDLSKFIGVNSSLNFMYDYRSKLLITSGIIRCILLLNMTELHCLGIYMLFLKRGLPGEVSAGKNGSIAGLWGL